MERIATTKFKKLNPKKGYIAPYIQLPWNKRLDLIGQEVEIFSVEGGYFIKVEKGEFKPTSQNDLEERVSLLESEIDELKRYIIQKGGLKTIEIKNKECCYGDSNPSRRSESPA